MGKHDTRYSWRTLPVTADQWSYLMKSFNIRGVPTYLLVDREGNITYKTTGFPGVDKMKSELLKVLNK